MNMKVIPARVTSMFDFPFMFNVDLTLLSSYIIKITSIYLLNYDWNMVQLSSVAQTGMIVVNDGCQYEPDDQK